MISPQEWPSEGNPSYEYLTGGVDHIQKDENTVEIVYFINRSLAPEEIGELLIKMREEEKEYFMSLGFGNNLQICAQGERDDDGYKSFVFSVKNTVEEDEEEFDPLYFVEGRGEIAINKESESIIITYRISRSNIGSRDQDLLAIRALQEVKPSMGDLGWGDHFVHKFFPIEKIEGDYYLSIQFVEDK